MPLKEDELPSWSFFSRRRQLDVKLWLEQKNITSYESLVNHLIGIGIKPPTSKEVSRFFVQPVPIREAPKLPAAKVASAPTNVWGDKDKSLVVKQNDEERYGTSKIKKVASQTQPQPASVEASTPAKSTKKRTRRKKTTKMSSKK